MISLPTIIITSLGRTGTKFFAKFFQSIIPSSISIHEPDIIHGMKSGQSTSEYLCQLIHQINKNGFQNLIIKKMFGNYSLIKVSDKRLTQKVKDNEAVKQMYQQRSYLTSRLQAPLYIESNSGYYGLINLIENVFDNVRVIYIVRDGKEWVRSWMNWGIIYEKNFLNSIFGHNWVKATELKDDSYSDKWYSMSRFEKTCWAWATLNKYSLSQINSTQVCKLFKFEDLFLDNNKLSRIKDLIEFCIDIPGLENIQIQKEPLEIILSQRENRSEKDFPEYCAWSKQQKTFFNETCGPLMMELGYQL